jgi:ferredoxin/coenzyme F420-reducing hydrogenase delta subunit
MPSAVAICRALEHGFDRWFGADHNPLKQLGALATALFGLTAATGVVLYAILDTSVAGAYRSIEALSAQPAGSIVRSLHRYAADAFVLVTLAHLAREWSLGRFKAFRRFSWLTGVPLLPLTLAIAIVGFWLNWDRLAQYSAIATAEWLDALPFLASPLARNFLSAIGDRLFSLLVFVHLGLPLLLVFALWMHVQRISRPRVVPARALAIGTGATLLLLALLLPVRSQGAADLGTVPQTLAFDWLLLFVHPLADATAPGVVWLLAAAVLALLLLLPFLSPRMAGAVPVVDAAHCNGCRRCADDCPYAAITMVPHPSGRAGMQLASVDPLLCASCGICAGACPSATPFRGASTLASGIDMPNATVDALRRRLLDGLAAQQGAYVVFGCDRGVRVQTIASDRVLSVGLACTAMLPPAFVEYALRLGAAGVLVAGCRGGGCEFRLGQRWTAQRLAGEREPRLRRSVPGERWATVWADAGEPTRLAAALAQLQAREPQQPAVAGALA